MIARATRKENWPGGGRVEKEAPTCPLPSSYAAIMSILRNWLARVYETFLYLCSNSATEGEEELNTIENSQNLATKFLSLNMCAVCVSLSLPTRELPGTDHIDVVGNPLRGKEDTKPFVALL